MKSAHLQVAEVEKYWLKQRNIVQLPSHFLYFYREFQWISQLPLSGTLDAITLHHMSLPRCGVNDAESHTVWKERMDALFSGGKARKSRRKRYLQSKSA